MQNFKGRRTKKKSDPMGGQESKTSRQVYNNSDQDVQIYLLLEDESAPVTGASASSRPLRTSSFKQTLLGMPRVSHLQLL